MSKITSAFDAVKSAVNANATKPSEEDQQVADVVATLHAKRADEASITERRTKAQFSLLEKRKALAKAAESAEITGQDTEFNRLSAEIAKDEAKLARLDMAADSIVETIREAEATLERLGREKRLAHTRRKLTLLEKKARLFQTATETYGAAFKDFYSAVGDVVATLPTSIAGEFASGLLGLGEIERSIALELRRVLPVEATINVPYPPLPGADGNPLIDPTKIPPIAQVVEDTARYAMERASAVGAPPSSTQVQSAQSVTSSESEPDADGLTEIEHAPSGPTHTAAAVMAAMKPKQLT